MKDDNYLRVPVNKISALVTSQGFYYKPEKRIVCVHRNVPIPLRKVESGYDLTGYKIGRLIVVGLAMVKKNGKKALWSCRCLCGRYVTRKAKSIKNKNNNLDRCEECRQLMFLKRKEFYHRTGKQMDEELLK